MLISITISTNANFIPVFFNCVRKNLKGFGINISLLNIIYLAFTNFSNKCCNVPVQKQTSVVVALDEI